MKEIIAYCGLVCSDCPAYVATQANDMAALEKVAAQWREQFNSPELTAESILCDGCLAGEGSRQIGYCAMCEIRACGMQKGVANCAHCSDYACEKVEAFFAHAPNARSVLDGIRSGLAG
jgi:hypothetical protein